MRTPAFSPMSSVLNVLIVVIGVAFALPAYCPSAKKFGSGPPATCTLPTDPNNLPPSQLEQWFSETIFNDLFPFANLGWGGSPCSPYSYESFIIAARYFPDFGTSFPNTIYTPEQNARRDLAAFFAHIIQETGENNKALYNTSLTQKQAAACFYRGGLFNWFQRGPKSSFLDPAHPGYDPQDGAKCVSDGLYCRQNTELNFWYPCSNETSGTFFTGCYFGRGPLQLSYNFNYGQFQNWLALHNIFVDLLNHPNLVMTKTDPPLAFMASLWFYMTPQPPIPSMHDIILGAWNPGAPNLAANYSGPIFGPTSLIINNQCGGEDPSEPGGDGESRRIKAFKWFCNYFQVPIGEDRLLTCKNMVQQFKDMKYLLSYQPDWSKTWKNEPCNCAPANYSGIVPYFDPAYYPQSFVNTNDENRKRCVKSLYENPAMYSMNTNNSPCLNYLPPL